MLKQMGAPPAARGAPNTAPTTTLHAERSTWQSPEKTPQKRGSRQMRPRATATSECWCPLSVALLCRVVRLHFLTSQIVQTHHHIGWSCRTGMIIQQHGKELRYGRKWKHLVHCSPCQDDRAGGIHQTLNHSCPDRSPFREERPHGSVLGRSDGDKYI